MKILNSQNQYTASFGNSPFANFNNSNQISPLSQDTLQVQSQQPVIKYQKKKEFSTVAKFAAIVAGIVTVLAVGYACKGKHIKQLLGKAKNNNVRKNKPSSSTQVNRNKINPQPATPSSSAATTSNINSKSVEDMRMYIQQKYNTGFDYKLESVANYANAIYKNYLSIRICTSDYYPMKKVYNANKLYDISRNSSKDIIVNDNDGLGWFYRFAVKNLKPGQKQPKVIDRISLNVYPEEGLIKDLDNFITQTGVNVEYKVPQGFKDWTTRHDPITMYFRENIPQSVKDDLINIVTPYVRTPKNEVMIGTKLANGIYQIPDPTEQDILSLIKRAEKLGDDKLVTCLQTPDSPLFSARLYTISHGKVVAKASAGQYKAAEMLIEDLEKYKNNIS